MIALSHGWSWRTLAEVVGSEGLLSDGDWVESKDQDPRGSIRLLQLADVGDGRFLNKSSRHINEETFARLRCTEVLEGDVLIARMPDPLGRACVVPKFEQRAVTVVDVAIVRPDSPDVCKRWLMRFLNAPQVREFMERGASGTTRRRIARSKLAELQLPVPSPAEQRRIADKLDRLLAAVDACKGRLDAIPVILRRFRQSVLAAATSGALTEEWRASNKAPPAAEDLESIRRARIAWAESNRGHNEAARALKQSIAPRRDVRKESAGLPAGWDFAELQEILHLIVDCHNKTAPYTDSGVALVRTSNIRDGQLVWDQMRYVDNGTYEYWSRRCPPEPGDIIFTREAPMGEVAVIPEGMRLCLGQRTMLFRLNHTFTVVRYLHLALMEEGFRQRARSSAVGTGVKHLRVGDVGKLALALPPRLEQMEIVRRVDALFEVADRIETAAAAAKANAQALTGSLLSRAFRGELSDGRSQTPVGAVSPLLTSTG